jgi:hypothetical protein
MVSLYTITSSLTKRYGMDELDASVGLRHCIDMQPRSIQPGEVNHNQGRCYRIESLLLLIQENIEATRTMRILSGSLEHLAMDAPFGRDPS